jgi:hypothetical protein
MDFLSSPTASVNKSCGISWKILWKAVGGISHRHRRRNSSRDALRAYQLDCGNKRGTFWKPPRVCAMSSVVIMCLYECTQVTTNSILSFHNCNDCCHNSFSILKLCGDAWGEWVLFQGVDTEILFCEFFY